MADHLIVEPDDLRRSAEQHRLIAADLRKWGRIPQDWLDEFPSTHGTIADPMYGALVDYYNDRHEKAERLASRNEQTRDQLLRAAEELEQRDYQNRQQISRAGGTGFDIPPDGAHGPGAPTAALPAPIPGPISPSPVNPTVPGPVPMAPPVPGQITPGMPSTSPPAVSPVPSSAPSAGPISPVGVGTSSVPIAPVGSGTSVGSLSPLGSTSTNGPAMRSGSIPPATGGAVAPASQQISTTAGTPTRSVSGIGTPAMTANPMAPGQRVFTPGPSAGPPPGPLSSGPLAASAQAAAGKSSRQSLVVGDTVDADLVLARTLLAAVLAAVGDSEPNMEWATAVAQTPRGPVLLLTSTAGRGWLPPGLFLPSEVIVPWRWYFAFREADLRTASALVGNDDPAQTLLEFLAIAGRGSNIRVSALASSTNIADSLRRTLTIDTAVADRVTAAGADADLSRPGPGLVDRLTAAGSDESLQRAETLSDSDIHSTCLEFVHAAKGQDQLLEGATTSHEAFIARRIDELLELSTLVPPTRATLRDMLYTCDQIADHPLGSERSAGSFDSEMERTG
ncbi:type VII secretion target [Nocardia sp. NPDC052001]|uniref:type VII secretion target n=1 Tax=Nocardia sp. NPDC052001 TaxID=3154853 RepID=UPI003449F6FB